jgi:hypothetical protein
VAGDLESFQFPIPKVDNITGTNLSEYEARGVVCMTRVPSAVDVINTYSLTDLEGEPIRL